jgi:hypothetical protein
MVTFVEAVDIWSSPPIPDLNVLAINARSSRSRNEVSLIDYCRGECFQMFEVQSAPYSPICPRCLEPVKLEEAKTDEDGRAMHEDCYFAMLREATLIARRRSA